MVVSIRMAIVQNRGPIESMKLKLRESDSNRVTLPLVQWNDHVSQRISRRQVRTRKSPSCLFNIVSCGSLNFTGTTLSKVLSHLQWIL